MLRKVALTFVFLWFFVGGIAHLAFTDIEMTIVPPIHMYRQLKGAYGLRRGGALWRTAALIVFAFVAVMLFFALLITLGLFD